MVTVYFSHLTAVCHILLSRGAGCRHPVRPPTPPLRPNAARAPTRPRPSRADGIREGGNQADRPGVPISLVPSPCAVLGFRGEKHVVQ